MNRLAPTYCDHCGWPIECLADAWVRLITGRNDFDVVSVKLVHRATARPKCTFFECLAAGHVQDYDAAEFLDERLVAGLRDLQSSRHVWPFARRLLMRVRRLGRLDRRAALRAKKPATRRQVEAA
jgi:hypothetical protein